MYHRFDAKTIIGKTVQVIEDRITTERYLKESTDRTGTVVDYYRFNDRTGEWKVRIQFAPDRFREVLESLVEVVK